MSRKQEMLDAFGGIRDRSELGGQLALAAQLTGAFGRVLFDRLEEVVGSALPRTPDQLARAEAINALISADTPEGQDQLPPVVAASLPGVEFGG